MDAKNVDIELRGEVLTLTKSKGDYRGSSRHVQSVQLQPESAEALRRALNLMEARHG